MANHGPSYGLSDEVKGKIASNYSVERENEVKNWIEGKTGKSIGADFAEGLKDGQILCQLANAIDPGCIRKVNTGRMPFVQMENIGFFLQAAQNRGVQANDLFQTVDLFEAKNMTQVILGLHAYARAVGENISAPGQGNPTDQW